MVDFNSIDRESLSDDSYVLLQDVEHLFNQMQDIAMISGRQPGFNKMHFILSYNLFLAGCFDQAIQMLEHVWPSYYEGEIEEDLKEAMEHWQKVEDLKNQVKKEKVEQRGFHEENAEMVQVILGMVQGLQLFEFNGKDRFDKFCERIEGKEFSIKIRPEIKSFKPDEDSD